MHKDKINIPGDEEGIREWYEKGEWLQDWSVTPHPSVDYRMVARHYFENPERWDSVFRMLKTCLLSNIEQGRYEIDGDQLFFTVSSYETKDPDVAKFEAHRRYLDIQYVFEGEELMGVASLADSKEKGPYNSEKDIIFYDVANAVYHKATPAHFFVFSPQEVHQPCVKVNKSTYVRKVVFKVKIGQ